MGDCFKIYICNDIILYDYVKFGCIYWKLIYICVNIGMILIKYRNDFDLFNRNCVNWFFESVILV